VLDFGVAKLMDLTNMTEDGAAIGTVSYMAPEQSRGAPVDGRADLYAVGACMYHALTGRLPFEVHSPLELLHALQELEPRRIESLRPDVDEAFAALVRRAMAKAPELRFLTAEEMADELEPWTRPTQSERGAPTLATIDDEPPRGARLSVGTESLPRPSVLSVDDDASTTSAQPEAPEVARPSVRARWLGLAAASVPAIAFAFVIAFVVGDGASTPLENPEMAMLSTVNRLDVKLFRFLNVPYAHPLGRLSYGLSLVGSAWTIAALAPLALVGRLRRPVVELAATVFGAGILAALLRQLIGRERPFVALDDVHVFTPLALQNSSCPSGAATVCFAAATFVASRATRSVPRARNRALVLGTLLLLALALSLARVVLGVNYPLDAAFGALLGAPLGMLGEHVMTRLPGSAFKR
jgi:membrane-associated phospholipid phosphatase